MEKLFSMEDQIEYSFNSFNVDSIDQGPNGKYDGAARDY